MVGKQSFFMQNQESGSSGSDGPDFLAVGKLRRPHGVRGEILMSVWTDFPERLEPGVVVYLGNKEQPVKIRSVRNHGQGLLVAFEGFPHREAVGELRNKVVKVLADDLPALENGEFYVHELIGMDVLEDEDDRYLGKLTGIIETGANDVYIVQGDSGPEILLPDIDSVILQIDPVNRQIRVHLLPGLLPGI